MTIAPPTTLEEAIVVIQRLERELAEARGDVVRLPVTLREGDLVRDQTCDELTVITAISGDFALTMDDPFEAVRLRDLVLAERGTDEDHRDMITFGRTAQAGTRRMWALAHRCAICEATP